MDIKESDWKVFRRLNSVALERYCQRVLEEVKLATACNDSYMMLLKGVSANSRS